MRVNGEKNRRKKGSNNYLKKYRRMGLEEKTGRVKVTGGKKERE